MLEVKRVPIAVPADQLPPQGAKRAQFRAYRKQRSARALQTVLAALGVGVIEDSSLIELRQKLEDKYPMQSIDAVNKAHEHWFRRAFAAIVLTVVYVALSLWLAPEGSWMVRMPTFVGFAVGFALFFIGVNRRDRALARRVVWREVSFGKFQSEIPAELFELCYKIDDSAPRTRFRIHYFGKAGKPIIALLVVRAGTKEFVIYLWEYSPSKSVVRCEVGEALNATPSPA